MLKYILAEIYVVYFTQPLLRSACCHKPVGFQYTVQVKPTEKPVPFSVAPHFRSRIVHTKHE